MGNSLTVLPRFLTEAKVSGNKSKKENGQGLNWQDSIHLISDPTPVFEIHYL